MHSWSSDQLSVSSYRVSLQAEIPRKNMIMCGEVCRVVLLTRWASTRPYTACGQIPGVPWNWHFVWIAGRPEGGLGCEVFCLSFHLLFKLRVSGHTYRLASPYFDFRKEVSAEYFPLFPPNLCLSTWLLALFPRVLPARPCSLIPGQFRRLFFLSLSPPRLPTARLKWAVPVHWSKKLFVCAFQKSPFDWNLSLLFGFVWRRPLFVILGSPFWSFYGGSIFHQNQNQQLALVNSAFFPPLSISVFLNCVQIFNFRTALFNLKTTKKSAF